MPHQQGTKSITYTASGALLDGVRRYAEANEITLSRASQELITATLERPAAPVVAPAGLTLTQEAHVAVELRARTYGSMLHQAASDLIEIAVARLDAPDPAPPIVAGAVSLETVPIEWLTTELARRVDAAIAPALLDAAIARAEAAEGQFATLHEQLRELLLSAAA